MSKEYDLGVCASRAGASNAKTTIETKWLPKSDIGSLSAHGGEIIIKERELIEKSDTNFFGYRVVLSFSDEEDALAFLLKHGDTYEVAMHFFALGYSELNPDMNGSALGLPDPDEDEFIFGIMDL